jgi:hypothetical protein
MALFDKVKSQAQDVAKRAQEAGRAGQSKLDDFQTKRQLDSLFHDLGAAVYAERKGTAGASSDAVERCIAAIDDHMAANADSGTSGGGGAAPTFVPTSGAAPDFIPTANANPVPNPVPNPTPNT